MAIQARMCCHNSHLTLTVAARRVCWRRPDLLAEMNEASAVVVILAPFHLPQKPKDPQVATNGRNIRPGVA